ncbi:PREDICTED: alpha-crystallin B chain-like [Vollenhovia emeryi]|uniref:alpha-crystallin B chain-like n=1 Tax=Vollenhovia emeryi TaxID=411798 RepID=UPI0005F49815|nr:PREDICTED: alpha-crystallin B chain-like [Vollenhovia emeryi]
MSLLPFILCELEDKMRHSHLGQIVHPELRRPSRLAFLPEDKTFSCHCQMMGPQTIRNKTMDELMVRNALELALGPKESESPRAPFVVEKDDFHVAVDVQHFKPEEIDVKTVDDHLIITAKHEERRDDHGWVSREFVRRYKLPKDVNVNYLISSLSSDGILTVAAPKNQRLKDEIERSLQIEFTGKPFVNTQPKTEQSENEKKTK